MRYSFPKPLYEQQRDDLKKLSNYVEQTYQQPRDSNKDNQAFINICNELGKILQKY